MNIIYHDVELHNIAEAREVTGRPGVRLQRVPETVRLGLEEPAQERVPMPGGAEIRFVLEGEAARIVLSSTGVECQARLFCGPFDTGEFWTIGSDPVAIDVALPDRLAELDDSHFSGLRFSPRVCRIVLYMGMIHMHSVEGAVRPPRRGETPRLTMLSYGTSITHGRRATAFHLSYVAQTAWRLGTDLINFGVGGSCRCEAAFADYMAELRQWDFATLALSVNMIGAGFSLDEFRSRTCYLIERIARSNPNKPVACLSIYPYFADLGIALQENAKAPPAEFRRVLEEVVRDLALPNLHFIPGPEILTDIAGLSADLIHPADNGMIAMGQALAQRLEPLVAPLLDR